MAAKKSSKREQLEKMIASNKGGRYKVELFAHYPDAGIQYQTHGMLGFPTKAQATKYAELYQDVLKESLGPWYRTSTQAKYVGDHDRKAKRTKVRKEH